MRITVLWQYRKDVIITVMNMNMNSYRNKFAALTAAAGILVAGCSNEQPPSSELTEGEVGTTISVEDVFKNSFLKFKEAYGCPTDVEIVTGPIPNDDNESIKGLTEGGQKAIHASVAIAESGKITINQDYQAIYPSIADQVNLPHIAAHQSVHACGRPPTLLSAPIALPNESVLITSTAGLGLVTNSLTPDGKSFQIIPVADEGAAEVIADALVGVDPLSQSTMPGYYGMKELTLTLMRNTNVSVEELVTFQQNNDLLGYFKKVSGLDNPTGENILELIRLYQQSEDAGQSVIG